MADTIFTEASSTTPGTVVHAPWLNDANTATYNHLSSVAGTNSITATGPLSMSAYAIGQKFFFLPAITNTSNTFINISTIGSVQITKYGTTALVAGDLVAGVEAQIVYDGTRFQLLNPQTFNLNNIVPITNGGTGAATAAQALINLGATGRLLNIQVFTATGTYTPTPGTTRVHVVGQGAGGAGGGCGAVGASQVGVGAGGAAGSRGQALILSSLPATVSVTIGSGGTGVAGGTGAAGGSTSFGAFLVLGGGGGGGAAATGAVAVATGGASPAATGTALLFASTGQAGGGAISSFAQGYAQAGAGGSSDYGSGSPAGAGGGPTSGGGNATGRGAGGSGAFGIGSGSAAAGGTGTGGILYVFEYS